MEPNQTVEPIHDRMPVILPDNRVDDWLFRGHQSAALADLLRPAPEDLLVPTPVSTRVNSVKNDGPACLEPVTYLL